MSREVKHCVDFEHFKLDVLRITTVVGAKRITCMYDVATNVS